MARMATIVRWSELIQEGRRRTSHGKAGRSSGASKLSCLRFACVDVVCNRQLTSPMLRFCQLLRSVAYDG